MTNRGPQSALGATVLLGLGDGGADVGLKGRYRRWLGDGGMALDVGTGLFAGSLEIVNGKANGDGVTGGGADPGRVGAVECRPVTAGRLQGVVELPAPRPDNAYCPLGLAKNRSNVG